MTASQTSSKSGTTSTPKPRGRAAKKIKLKHNPRTSTEDYIKRYGDWSPCAIYGVDDFTKNLINTVWERYPQVEFVVADPNESRLDNLNEEMENRQFSADRWFTLSHEGFVEIPVSDVIVVSKEYEETVKSLPNPQNVKIVILEEI